MSDRKAEIAQSNNKFVKQTLRSAVIMNASKNEQFEAQSNQSANRLRSSMV